MTFLTEEVRTSFHSLPVDKQRPIVDFAEEQLRRGNSVRIDWAEMNDRGELEISFRIDKEFEPSTPAVG
jgi:hypothetical protein